MKVQKMRDANKKKTKRNETKWNIKNSVKETGIIYIWKRKNSAITDSVCLEMFKKFLDNFFFFFFLDKIKKKL